MLPKDSIGIICRQQYIYPFMIHYVDGSGKLTHKSYACISDHKTHDIITVYSFLKQFYEHYVSNEFPFLHKVFYFSDGSAAQYKNFKNLMNLIFYQNDFHIQAEWNFFLQQSWWHHQKASFTC